MNFFKKMVTGVFLILTIIAISLYAFVKIIRPETIKSYVGSQLSILTNHKSQITGDIAWQIFPLPGIKITGVQIGNALNNENYSIKLDSLLFHLKFTPLLRGKLVFTELNVDGFKVTINPYSPSQPATKAVATIAQDNATTTKSMTETFAIERFLLSRGEIIIKQGDKKTVLSGLQIGAEQFNLQKRLFPFQFKSMLHIKQKNESLLKANINFKGSTALSPALLNNTTIDLQNIRTEGQLSLQEVSLKKFKINGISARAKTKKGVLTLNPLTFNLYNGQSIGELRYAFNNKKLSFNQTATHIDSAKLSNDLTGRRLLAGIIDFSIHGQADMQTVDNWQSQLNSNGSLTIKEGSIESINIDKLIDETSMKINKLLTMADAKDKQQTLKITQFDNPEFFKGKTNFELLTFQYQIQNSTLQVNTMVLQANRLQLTGDSTINLKTSELNSRLLAKVSLSDSKVERIQQLLGGSFPILITGTLTMPLVLPDLQKINPILTKLWLQEALTKPVETIIIPVQHIHKHLKKILDKSH